MSKVQNICIITFLSFTFVVGVLVFSRGFLLNRRIITEKSGQCISIPNEDKIHAHTTDPVQVHPLENTVKDVSSYLNWCRPSTGHSKFILLLVDALKFDFVKRMAYLSKIINNDLNQVDSMFSCLFKFLADPPTTTMQRLKALTTGTMPTFIDASANFNSYEISEDSLIHQLFSVGKRIAFLGDDTWLSLFPRKYFTSKFVEGHPSFNAWDLDTVDTAVNSSIRKIVSAEHEDDWDVLVAHMLGVDHCGHRYGPNHPEMSRKLAETDDVIKFLYNSMTPDTLLVIFGDHGMTNTGDHGGDSVDESESALIVITKNQQLPLTCPKKVDGAPVEVSQIDLVPTLSTLVGFPIPYSSIGQVIPGFLPSQVYTDAVAANIAQINQYVAHYSGELNKTEPEQFNSNSMQSSVRHLFEEVDKSFQNRKSSEAAEKMFVAKALEYFSEVKTIGKNTWTQFDVPVIYTGIFISLLSVVLIVIYICALPIFAETKVKYSVLSWMWPSLSHWSILSACLLRSNAVNVLLGIVISTLAGLLVFFAAISFKLTGAVKTILSIKRSNMKTTSNTGKHLRSKKGFSPNLFSTHRKQIIFFKNLFNVQLRLEYSEIIAIVLYTFTCLGVFSNSYVINEGYILCSVLLAVILIHLMCSRSALATLGIPFNGIGDAEDNKYIVNLPIVRKHFKCSWSSFIFLAIMTRISQTFFRCREELQDCQEEFLLHKQLASLPSDWVVNKFVRYGIELVSLAVFVVVFRHWLMYRQISASSRPSALVAKYVPTILVVLNCAFRALQGLPFASLSSIHIRPVFENLPRVFHLVTIASVAVLWWKPLCCVGRFRPFRRARRFHYKDEISTNCNPAFVKNSSKGNDSRSMNVEIKINGNPPPSEMTGNGSNYSSESKTGGSRKLSKMEVEHFEKTSSIVPLFGDDNLSEDLFTSVTLTMGVLLTLLLVHVTSEGMSPSNAMIMYTAVCLAGIYRSTPNHNINSWSSVIAWTLASQYFFYGTGHQPVFSAIPWDSAFVASSNSSSLGSSPESIMSWISPALSVVGNLHVSQIIFTVTLPLLTYWKADKERPETLMGGVERKNAFIIYGKFLALHGFKLLACMTCAAWQRRHLMVWKIFAPKLIFEAISFIVTSMMVTLSMLFLTRIDYAFQRFIVQERRWFKEVVPAC